MIYKNNWPILPSMSRLLIISSTAEHWSFKHALTACLHADVVLAKSGHEAVNLIKQSNFSMIFLAHSMVDISGEALAELLQNSYEVNIPIVFMDQLNSNNITKKTTYTECQLQYQLKKQQQLVSLLTNVCLKKTKLLNNIDEGTLFLNTNGNVITINKYACQILQNSNLSLLGLHVSELFANKNLTNEICKWQQYSQHIVKNQWLLLVLKNGEKRMLLYHWVPLINNKFGYYGSIFTFTEISQQYKLVCEARYDSLTGAPNRNLLYKFLQMAIARNHRQGKHLGLLFIDLDLFKQINDLYSHEAGDFLLNEVVLRLKSIVRSSDMVSRFGGDEFVVVLDDIRTRGDLLLIAEKIIEIFASPVIFRQHILIIKASIGISFWPEDGKTLQELIHASDVAMYHAKKTGNNPTDFINLH